MALVWLAGLLLLFVVQLFVILFREYRMPSRLAAWLFIVYIVPVLGSVLYLVMTNGYRKKRFPEWDVHVHGQLKPSARPNTTRPHRMQACRGRLQGLIDGLPAYPPGVSERSELYTDGAAFFEDLLRDLAAAGHHIHMQFYIFRDDETGNAFIELLKEKAKQGVEVRIILDGVGCLRFPRRKIRELRDNGVRLHIFLPLLMSLRRRWLNYRNHRKIVVCDGRCGYVGGMNIGAEYSKGTKKLGKWRDTQLRVEGDCVYGLQHTFLKDWELVTGEKLADRREYYPMRAERGASDEAGNGEKISGASVGTGGPAETLKEDVSAGTVTYDLLERDGDRVPDGIGARGDPVQMIPSGPDQQIHAMFLLIHGLLTTARSSIYITTPYFVPEESIQVSLISAAVSGVDVRILIPSKADSRLSKLATLSHLEELMSAGVRVYEYQAGFIHAKTLIVDSMFATVGTSNMDMRSFFNNFEMNVFTYSPSLVRKLEDQFWTDLGASLEIDYETFRKRPLWRRMTEAVARMLSPLF